MIIFEYLKESDSQLSILKCVVTKENDDDSWRGSGFIVRYYVYMCSPFRHSLLLLLLQMQWLP